MSSSSPNERCIEVSVSDLHPTGSSGTRTGPRYDAATDRLEGPARKVLLEREIAKLISIFEELKFDVGRYPQRWLAIKLLEADSDILERVQNMPNGTEVITHAQQGADHLKSMLGDDVDLLTADRRYGYINGIVRQALQRPLVDRITLTDRIDDIVTHKWLGLPVFFAMMYVIFRLVIDVSSPFLDWTDAVINGPLANWLRFLLNLMPVPTWIHSLVIDGIVAGVGGVLVFVPGLLILYFFLAGNALTSYQLSINHLFSESSRINLSWVRWLINGYLILLLIMIGLYFMILRSPENFGFIILINTAIVTPYMYAVAFRGLTQPTLWQVRHESTPDRVEAAIKEAESIEELIHDEEPNSQKTTVPQEKIDEIIARVTRLMVDSKLYLQSELTLQDLAEKLDIPSYQATQAINEGLDKNFYDLVNGYRVEEAKRLLSDPGGKNNKILAVGMDAGFNSKTTFNTVFKKFTGLTPSEFKDQQLKSIVQA
jgi:AraC-like DNA-binding protein